MDSNPGFGALFRNRKQAGNQPEMRGGACCPSCQTQLELAGWTKEDRNGGKYLNLKLQPQGQRDSASASEPADDDIPF